VVAGGYEELIQEDTVYREYMNSLELECARSRATDFSTRFPERREKKRAQVDASPPGPPSVLRQGHLLTD
jgi:hypothetical protein